MTSAPSEVLGLLDLRRTIEALGRASCVSARLGASRGPVSRNVTRRGGGARGAGAEIVYPLTEEDWGLRRFFVRDPNGAVINVTEHT